MMNRILRGRALLTLVLAAVLILGLWVPVGAETVTAVVPVTELETGTYTLVINFSTHSYYLPYETVGAPDYPGLALTYYDTAAYEQADRWEVTRISDSRCTLRNPAKGEHGYLNLSADGSIVYGARQEIFYDVSGGLFRFFITQGTTRYYIRVTGQNVRRFHAGSGTSSNAFQLLHVSSYEVQYTDAADDPLPEGDPLLTVACISDIHTDYSFQSSAPYVRGSTYKALNRIAREEDADVVLFGGDNTSDNANQSLWAWDVSVYEELMEQFDLYASAIAPYQIWACGNHDDEAGEDEGYDSYQGYEALMRRSNGDPESVYRQRQDTSLTDRPYPDYILGLHYELEGFNFIVLNSPYGKVQTYSSGTYQWLEGRLRLIGEDQTVFLVTHYPLAGSRGNSNRGYGVSGEDYTRLTGILNRYPNLIYLYGHDHGGSDSVVINQDTFERITSYTSSGVAVEDRNVVPTSFISSFMGSMSFSKITVTPEYLQDRDSDVVQALMIYVYADRLVFQMKNYGAHPRYADVIPLSWTVMRQTVPSSQPSVEDPVTDVSGDNAEPGVSSDGSDRISGSGSSSADRSDRGTSSSDSATDLLSGSLTASSSGTESSSWIPVAVAIGAVLLAAAVAFFLWVLFLYKKITNQKEGPNE